ncbi:MAG TPA: undecaprenyldiphospho-muramoylpentapeptide beta-N-acetylglucosaminyltransferase [Chitinophagales bacterium]
MSANKTYKFIISGGGSGGHIFPAIAIANELKRRLPGCAILFVGANGRMEMEKVPQAGYEIKGLNIAGFQRGSITKNLVLPFKLISSLADAISIVKSFKPDVAIGVGGYASGPLLFAASLCGVPTLIQEQNATAGLTNRLLSKRAKTICAAYEELQKVYVGKNVVLTGNPIRSEIASFKENRDEAINYFGLAANKKTILMIGGSLGAGTFNEAVKNQIETIKNNHDIQIIWQTGKAGFEKYKSVADGVSNLKCLQFIDRMDLAYSIADVVISRGGAMSISELQVLAKPVVFVPSPNVTDDQQTKNVMALVHKNAAVMVRDLEARTTLISEAITLLNDEQKRKTIAENLGKMALPNAAEKIGDEVLKLVR